LRRVNSTVVFAAFGLLISARPSPAHHSFLAEFDQRKPVTVTGVVTKVEWQNPHAFFYVDSKDANGKVVKWSFQTATPSALTNRGWKRESVKAGDQVTVQGYLAKHGTNFAAARSVLMPNGQKVFTGTMDDGGPDQ
jgi:Family of unknown function (DUF6152)